ncbi:hypothetical protein ANACOL_01311 [Anaerotruncus colihominis DSM 17241]|uniref:Uncharacterized protein n=1 Tax=Anaerotruncus colihominis DSM 17241 TaxID=445972 RepID=B0P965_9FIRM|nr:hypothetical protein ANACOL_01311 [Anaerotruncus colihominis DSM 17241]
MRGCRCFFTQLTLFVEQPAKIFFALFILYKTRTDRRGRPLDRAAGPCGDMG